ncbi:unnamed protein product, partial [Timema podura]|nr:unnamed protein product [Timema podura]
PSHLPQTCIYAIACSTHSGRQYLGGLVKRIEHKMDKKHKLLYEAINKIVDSEKEREGTVYLSSLSCPDNNTQTKDSNNTRKPPRTLHSYMELYKMASLPSMVTLWCSLKDRVIVLSVMARLLPFSVKKGQVGHGKTHKDAASVRATHAIPAACGLYYFEVKIVSKGRDGYMGIGLSAQGVNMNRLPGWDKHSYGYHGDDGHSFCSSGTGQPYGPTFTTGDVIGCGVNLIDNTCFYTKNGHNLGVAFTDLPPNLYPTVGLQTPGEVVDANFGQAPFVFDIEDMMRELRARTQATIHQYPVPDNQGEWQATLHK